MADPGVGAGGGWMMKIHEKRKLSLQMIMMMTMMSLMIRKKN